MQKWLPLSKYLKRIIFLCSGEWLSVTVVQTQERYMLSSQSRSIFRRTKAHVPSFSQPIKTFLTSAFSGTKTLTDSDILMSCMCVRVCLCLQYASLCICLLKYNLGALTAKVPAECFETLGSQEHKHSNPAKQHPTCQWLWTEDAKLCLCFWLQQLCLKPDEPLHLPFAKGGFISFYSNVCSGENSSVIDDLSAGLIVLKVSEAYQCL